GANRVRRGLPKTLGDLRWDGPDRAFAAPVRATAAAHSRFVCARTSRRCRRPSGCVYHRRNGPIEERHVGPSLFGGRTASCFGGAARMFFWLDRLFWLRK